MDFDFYKRCFSKKNGPKKGSKVWKIEVLKDTTKEIELGDTAADIQMRREEREARERKETQKQREKARREETTHTTEGGVAKKRVRIDRSDI